MRIRESVPAKIGLTVLAAGAAGLAMWLATPADADPHIPKICEKHVEHSDSPTGRKAGDRYIAACSIGPGNGGFIDTDDDGIGDKKDNHPGDPTRW